MTRVHSMKLAIPFLFAFALIFGIHSNASAATLLGPSHYLCFDTLTIAGCGANQSPFVGDYNAGHFDYFHLEDFEDHLFNVPGTSASAGGVTSVIFGPSIHDSVDADDGVIDGSGLNGDSYFYSSGSIGVTFSFDDTVLGMFPTHVGIVWTDGAGDTTFEAFGSGGGSLGTVGPVSIANGSFNGETDEDSFFGVFDASGISAIHIQNSSGGIEVDHLQYGKIQSGNGTSPAVPEPVSLLLVTVGLSGFALTRNRFSQKSRPI